MNPNENKNILNLRSKLTKLHIVFKQTLKNTKTNAFSTCVAHLWFANINIQFILKPCAVTTYCASYMTKINKSITLKLYSIIQKCIANN